MAKVRRKKATTFMSSKLCNQCYGAGNFCTSSAGAADSNPNKFAGPDPNKFIFTENLKVHESPEHW